MYIKSPLNYTGGKYKILAPILNAFPQKIDTFVDLFAGGFNVGINVEASKIICNDHIHYIIDMYEEFAHTNTDELLAKINQIIEKYQLDQQNTQGYLNLREDYNETPSNLYLFVLTCYAFNHQIRFNNQRKFNSPFGRGRSSYNGNIEKNLIAFSQALKNKNIEYVRNDFTKINLEFLGANDLVYCDPPYLISSSAYHDGKRGFKDWSEKEEKELLQLLDCLDQSKIKFALSNVLYHKGMENKLLIEWSKKYNVMYIDKSYSNCSYQFKDRNTNTVEVLVTNFVTK